MVKITKALARKMFENGEEIMIIPNRMKTTGPMAMWFTKQAEADTFDRLCTAIFYYNCSPETGMDLAYYAKEV